MLSTRSISVCSTIPFAGRLQCRDGVSNLANRALPRRFKTRRELVTTHRLLGIVLPRLAVSPLAQRHARHEDNARINIELLHRHPRLGGIHGYARQLAKPPDRAGTKLVREFARLKIKLALVVAHPARVAALTRAGIDTAADAACAPQPAATPDACGLMAEGKACRILSEIGHRTHRRTCPGRGG